MTHSAEELFGSFQGRIINHSLLLQSFLTSTVLLCSLGGCLLTTIRRVYEFLKAKVIKLTSRVLLSLCERRQICVH